MILPLFCPSRFNLLIYDYQTLNYEMPRIVIPACAGMTEKRRFRIQSIKYNLIQTKCRFLKNY